MAINGPEALRSLDGGLRDIRSEEQKISRMLARSTERVAKLKETETGYVRQLAEIQLDKTAREEISSRLSRAERRAHKVLEEHDSALGKAEKTLKKLDMEIAGKASSRRTKLDEIDEAQQKLKALSSKIFVEIAKDPAFEEAKKRAEELEIVAEQSLAKTEVAEEDHEQKGRPYRNDPLFMYLWDKGFGTKNYKAGNLTRWLDGMVARKVGFQNARPNFAMLNEIPLRLREHAEYQSRLAEEAEEELDKLEIAAIDAAGGKPLRARLLSAQEKLKSFDEEMALAEDKRDEAARAYRHLAEGRSPAFEEAAAMLAKNLGGEDIASLIARARQTSTGRDDVIVKKIDDLRSRIKDEEPEAKQYRARLRTLSTRRRELEDIEWEFKKARFDDPRSTFRKNDLTGSLLSEFLAGAISAAVYWNQWQSSQSWRAGSSDWGGGVGLPRAGRRPKSSRSSRSSRGSSSPWSSSRSNRSRSSSKPSSGFSRPRSGSRGSRKSGGFKTGGGF